MVFARDYHYIIGPRHELFHFTTLLDGNTASHFTFPFLSNIAVFHSQSLIQAFFSRVQLRSFQANLHNVCYRLPRGVCGVIFLSAVALLPWRREVCSSWRVVCWRDCSLCTGGRWMWMPRRTKIAALRATELTISLGHAGEAVYRNTCICETCNNVLTNPVSTTDDKRTQCVALTDAGFNVARQFMHFRRASQRLFFGANLIFEK